MQKDYEINLNTLIIIPINEEITKVIEAYDTFFVSKNALDIIKYSCIYFGSSYEGRIEATKNLIGMNYKLPIIIEESRDIVFFPTSSFNSLNCCWIALNNIERYVKSDKNCMIYFNNNKIVEINISYESLENQIFRSMMLLSKFKKRKNM